MITILRHGDKKRTTCHNCACIFTYQKEDVITKDRGRNEIDHYVICPDCGEECIAQLLK